MDAYWSQACQSSTGIDLIIRCQAYLDGVLDKIELLWEDMNYDGVDNIIQSGLLSHQIGYPDHHPLWQDQS